MSNNIKKKNWKFVNNNQELSKKIADHLDISLLIAQILVNRNIGSYEEAELFLNPPKTGYLESFDQELLKAAACLLNKEIKANNKIFIVGDYDVDGITSTAMLIEVLSEIGADFQFYIPHRFSEGYGLNYSIIEKVIYSNTGLLITLDCGISNYEEIAYLKEKSDTKVLILDHHTTPEKKPPAEYIINSKELGPEHPSANLCTAGITYKFLEYFIKAYGYEINIEKFLDMAALGTVADVVPLLGENRVMTRRGLKVLSKRTNKGIRNLLELSKCQKSILNARDIGFIIAPRINAAGRLTHAKIGVELLTSKSEEEARQISGSLEKLNNERREIGERILKHAEAKIAKAPEIFQEKVMVFSDDTWHAGVIGITASQLVQKYNLPVVLISVNGDLARGSARSVDNVNIFEVLKQCSEYFVNFGGHKEAAGFSILPEKIDAFKKAFYLKAREMITDSDLEPQLELDAKILPKDINLDLVQKLQSLAPFGQGNPTPVLYTDELIPIDFRTVGNGMHLKATFSDKTGKILFDAIGFRLADKLEVLYKKEVELAFHLEINAWTGVETVQLNLVDVR